MKSTILEPWRPLDERLEQYETECVLENINGSLLSTLTNCLSTRNQAEISCTYEIILTVLL